MDTVNLVLMIVLSAMIGFGIGNAWGKESMKRIFAELLGQLTNGITAQIEAGKKANATGTDEEKE